MASKSSVATKTVPTKAKAALPKDAETPEKDGAETAEKDAPPLLDLSDAAVKKMIKQAKKRGYVTYEPVSYTHLDVYKRQVHDDSPFAMASTSL